MAVVININIGKVFPGLVAGILLAVFSSLLTSCSTDDSGLDVSITRLDQIIAEYSQYDEAVRSQLLNTYRRDFDAMFTVLGTPDPTVETLSQWAASPVVCVFQPTVDSVYQTIAPLQHQLSHILRQSHEAGLRLPPLHYATVVWGNPRPLVRVDSVMLIALNHYLGADYPGYSHWERYRRVSKTPQMLPYDLAAALAATQHPMAQGDHALIEWMLYEGALVRARMLLVPDADLAMAMGYTEQQLEFAKQNLSEMWQELAINKLIYSTEPTVIDRYISTAPDSPLMQSRAPGRVCCYIGYRIVESYVSRHSGTTLDYLLSPAFYANQQSLIDSGFGGR